MQLYSIIVGLSAGICLGFAILFGFVGLRRQSNRRLSLLFSLFALGYAGTLIMGLFYRQAATVEQFVAINRWDPLFLATAFIALLWYVAEYTDVKPRFLLWGLTGAYLAASIAHIARPTLSFAEISGLELIALPWGEEIAGLAGTDSIWSTIYFVAQLLTIVYIVFAAVLQFRRGERRAATLLGLGAGWFVLTLAAELLGEFGIVPYLPLAEIGFLGLAITSSIQMANEVVRAEEELEAYQATLQATVAERTAALKETQAQLVSQAEETAVAEERNRLARDLHDAVTQTLYSSALIAEAVSATYARNPEEGQRNLGKLQQLTSGALAEMRTLLFELRPDALEAAELESSLGQVATAFTGRTRIPVDLDIDVVEEQMGGAKTEIFRIVQEGLNNVAKHAEATHVSIALQGDKHGYVLHIVDNGIGFRPGLASSDHMGLTIMAERARDLGGSLHIVSEPGQGADIVIEVPRNHVEDTYGKE